MEMADRITTILATGRNLLPNRNEDAAVTSDSSDETPPAQHGQNLLTQQGGMFVDSLDSDDDGGIEDAPIDLDTS